MDLPDTLPLWLTITIGASILGLAYIVATLLKLRCQHRWVNQGKPMRWSHVEDGVKCADYRQTVRCELCGKVTWFQTFSPD